MCSFFGQGGMELNYQGDLTDIVRASGTRAMNLGNGMMTGEPVADYWQFTSDPMNISVAMEEPRQYFGDPFSNMRDPFLNELDIAGSGFFNFPNSAEMINASAVVEDTGSFVGGNSILTQKSYDVDQMKSPCNLFTQMLQISPNAKQLPVSPCDSPVMAAASPRGIKASVMVPGDMINANSSKGCLVENTGMQISSPRNPVGVKRRKSQAKKVVCVPAPAAVNSRPTGEVVPSDLWAWRKYGQKPIKGSPYPRGYYRCSSSKGCSARKQVERSRNDPNMLVVTYTSEHNHPWPTQRNALAGSTRSQPSKTNAAASKSPPRSQSKKTAITKEEPKDVNNGSLSPIVAAGSSTTSASVKEEIEDIEKQMDMDDEELSGGFPQSYRPAMPDNNNQSEDFYADLGEIEAVPGNLTYTQGFTGDDQQKESKMLDQFVLFDHWPGYNTASFGEAKRGL